MDSLNSLKFVYLCSIIPRAVCASTLARSGVSVTLFKSARVPSGRMSQRRYLFHSFVEDGKELLFDHCAPFFNANNTEVLGLVHEWESKGLVACSKEKFGFFDHISNKFVDPEQFGASVGGLESLEDENLWSLIGSDGQNLGQFKGVVATDKNLISLRFTSVTGRQPLLDLNLVPELSVKLNDIPVRPCFALMIAFSEPQSSIPFKCFSIRSSEVLSWAHCESSKPGRSTSRKMSEGKNRENEESGLEESRKNYMIPLDFVCWEGPFPAASVAREEKCLWDKNKRLAIRGDFCVSPNVEGAIASRIAAASKLTEILSCL
ncbi:hypothetical protein D8674_002970 [Pyrus ussuriensis x Pyrus communis]|uniref:Uncharacterized protein n=1 Tax=Pyrus ussuriensis x Pyrus communis TaxID=2448454 RepID=A0A5N5FFS4_9ROSA|nr:hypothetical protein D8674_002970 [Pyrus ussuriensis x Pyrus communis]